MMWSKSEIAKLLNSLGILLFFSIRVTVLENDYRHNSKRQQHLSLLLIRICKGQNLSNK